MASTTSQDYSTLLAANLNVFTSPTRSSARQVAPRSRELAPYNTALWLQSNTASRWLCSGWGRLGRGLSNARQLGRATHVPCTHVQDASLHDINGVHAACCMDSLAISSYPCRVSCRRRPGVLELPQHS